MSYSGCVLMRAARMPLFRLACAEAARAAISGVRIPSRRGRNDRRSAGFLCFLALIDMPASCVSLFGRASPAAGPAAAHVSTLRVRSPRVYPQVPAGLARHNPYYIGGCDSRAKSRKSVVPRCASLVPRCASLPNQPLIVVPRCATLCQQLTVLIWTGCDSVVPPNSFLIYFRPFWKPFPIIPLGPCACRRRALERDHLRHNVT